LFGDRDIRTHYGLNFNFFRIRRNTMENKRYVSQLHWVFDLPDADGMNAHGKGPTRVMMIYDRTTNSTRFEILDKGLSKDARDNIAWWLRNKSHVCDAVNGPA
jgi:hypothetical protein